TDKRLMIGYRSGAHPVSANLISPLTVRNGKVLIAKYSWNSSHDGSFPVAAEFDVEKGTSMDVGTAPMLNAQFVADNQGAVRFAFGRGTDQKARVYYRAGQGDPWELVIDESKDKLTASPLRFNRAGDAVYFTCEGANKVGGLCLWNVATRKLTTLWSGSESGLTELVTTFDDQDLIAIGSMPNRPATTLLDKNAPEAKLVVGLMQQFPGANVSITSGTRDGKKAIVLVESDTDPGQFFLYDADTRKLSFLLARRPWIKPEEMAPMEPVLVKARDGLPLHGYLTRPPGKSTARDLPLVVYVHGGPYFIRDVWGYDPEVQAMASRGYAVLQVNFRGSGGYGDAFVHAGFREWGGKMQDDVTDATHWAIKEGIADPKRICIFGASYGGYAALQGVVREPDLYRCAIGYVGVYDLRLMYSRGDIPQSMSGENYLKRVLGSDESVLWDRSPIAHIDSIKAKLMLIVGGADWRVPPIQGENLHSALNKAHVEHEWIYERTEGHGFYEEGHVTSLVTSVLAFLDKNIGASAAQ
ncbi:MAG: alpha/beta hydrolase family protein, partial [Rhodanobacteraceae bacterium]